MIQEKHRTLRKRRTIPTETEMKSTNLAPSTRSIRGETQNLEVRYGKIGISAVAAAMRYQGDATIPEATAPQPDRWLNDMVPEIAA
jgi:hypothetical protein